MRSPRVVPTIAAARSANAKRLPLSVTRPSEVPPADQRHVERIDKFDALRGIAILFVMYLHAYFDPWANVPHNDVLFLRASLLVANSAVPVFLFMSGFLSTRDRSTSFSMLIQSRLRRVAVPLAFWMILALLFEIWLRGELTPEMMRSFALFDIAGQYYYVLVLLLLTAACYPLRHVDDRRLRWIVVAAFLVNLATIAWYQANPLTGFWWSMAYRNPMVWVFAFTFGLYLGRTRGNVRFDGRTILVVTGAMIAFAVAYMLIGERAGYPNSYFGVTVFLFAACGFVVYPAALRAIDRTRIGHVLLAPFVSLAPYAFGIYLVHKPYFVGYFSDRWVSDSFVANDYLRLVGSLFLVGGALSIAFVVLMNEFFPKFAAIMLGVDRPRSIAVPRVRPRR